ncbi:MAG TPA: GNAT family N-acetyltransferase [Thermoanaerobaculia bacterium]|nr:GNAT family N-acetyltransferase [Thermoanaerobaculia bacterium]
MIEALDVISRECFHSFGVLPNARVIDGDVTGVVTEMPITFFNGIGTTGFTNDNADARVRDVIDLFGKPFRWWITPATRPSNLREVLERNGLRHVYDSAGMTIDLADIAAPQGPVEQVRSDAQMHVFADVLTTVFERPKSDMDIWTSAYGRIGYDANWAHLIAFDDGRAAAIASVLLCGDVAGIYLVGTLKEARGKGLGTAATLAALQHAKAHGARVGALQSSAIGESVYSAMGFVSHGPMPMYEWRG